MGNNNLHKVENTLRSIAKRYKSVKYSLGLAILFLMMGVSAFSEETVQEVPTNEQIAVSRDNLKNSVGNLQSKIDNARAENEKKLKGLKLELIQLMEQGDQVIKSNWTSWQFGAGYAYNEWTGKYKGIGDRDEKYVYQGVYRRGNWKERNAMDIAENTRTNKGPITPGNENTSSWKTTGSSTKGGVKIKKDLSIDSGTNGNREWGLVKLRNIKEPTNEVEILAKISPKDVSKARLDIPVKVQAPAEIKAPVVNPNVNKPKEAPVVRLPKASSPEIPNDPTLNPNPTINIMKVNQVGNITVNPNPVTPVDFFIAPGGPHQHLYSSTEYDHTYDNNTTNLNIGPLYFWGIIPSGNTTLINANLNVINPISRAIVVDEGRAAAGDTFTYRGGTIRLTQSKNAGIDVQGTHMGSYSNIYQMKVINQGNIIGVGGTGISEHAAFAFNNFDSSSDSTRVHLVNDSAGGKIELNTPTSAGMMLRPEITQADNNYQGGLNMQMAENSGEITVNGKNSVGVTVVKSASTASHLANNGFLKTSTHVIIPVGQLLASRSDEANKSGILNTGTINVQGDDSSGVAILNMIQDVRVNGKINVGTVDPSTLSGPNGASPTLANSTSGANNKVEGAVGVYTEVATRPVRGRTYTYNSATKTETITDRYYDDHGLENTTNIVTGTYTDANGVTQNRHSGVTIGTETVEVGGIITLGDYAEKSFGLRNNTSTITTKDSATNTATTYRTSGSITLLNGGKVIVKGKKNFGAVSAGDTYEREVKKGSANYPIRVNEVGKIDINNGGEITVTGEQSIGYAMLSGAGTNAGKITVAGQPGNTASASSYDGSLGFYGKKGTFTNAVSGVIKTSGKLAHTVVLKQASATPTPEMTFHHYGEINVASPSTDPGNMGVFSDGYARANFYNGSKVYVGDDSVGIHTSRIDGFNHTFKNLGTLGIKIGARSTFAYLDGNATTTLKEFFNNGSAKVNIVDPMGTESSLVYANNQAKAKLDADYTITQGAANSTIALLAANKSEVNLTSGKTLTTNTQVALAAVNGTAPVVLGSGSTALNEGAIVSTRTQDAIGIYTKDEGSNNTGGGSSNGINKGSITMKGKKAVGMYGQNVTKLENSTATSSIKLEEEESIGMYGEIGAINTAVPLVVKNNGTIELAKKKSVGIYLKNASTKTPDPKIDLTAENNKEIKITGGTESIGIYAPKSKVSKVGKVTMANGVKKSIAAFISEGTTIADTTSSDINLGTSGTNIAYYVKNKDTSLGTSADLGKVTGYGIGVYLTGTSSTDKAVLAANAPEFNFKKGGATGDGIIGLYVKGDTDISAYTKTITVGDRKGTETNPINATGVYVEAQGTSSTPYTIKAKIKSGKNSVGIFSNPGVNKSYVKYLGTQMNLGEGATGFFVNGKTELDTAAATTTINLAGGVVAYVTENSEFVAGKTTVNLSKSAIGVYGEKGAQVDVGSWTFNNNGNAAEEVRLKEGQAKVITNKNLKPKMVLTHVINGETYLAANKTVTSVHDGKYKSEENIGLMAQGLKNPTPPTGITAWYDANYEIVNSGTINFTTAKNSTAIFAESARAKNDGVIKLGQGSTGIYGVYRDNTPKYATGIPNKLEIETTSKSDINLGKNSTGMYLVNAQKLTSAAGGKIESAAGATNNVGIYAINGKVDVKGSVADKAEANSYNSKTANFNILNMDNKADITLGNGSVGIYTRGKGTAIADRNIVKNDGNIKVGKTLTGAPAVGIYAENTQLTHGVTATPSIIVGEKGLAFYGKNSEITAKGTVNYSNKGNLAFLEKSKFTSHYGNLTAHQNTILFLKNSIANMDGAGTKIDITVPDKAATSDIFAGVYVEGTSQLNGVKKIEIGKNSNGIFMKNAVFTSSVNDIVSTKVGAKGLLAIESNLINNSKITLSGNKSIGIYSDANNTKTVTNNGKLTLSGKQTLGAFLKGSQTFVNTADIDIADTTSSNPAEKTVGIYTKDGTSTIKHNSGNIEVGKKSIGIFSTTNSGVEMNGGKIHVKDEAIGFYKQNGTLLLKGQINVDPHTAIAKNSEPVGVYALNGANVTDSASKITVGAKSYGFIFDNDSALTNRYTSTGVGNVTLGNDSVFLYSNGKAILTNNRNITSASERLIGFYIKGNSTAKGDFTNNATINFANTKGSIGIYAPGGKATNKGRILVGYTDDKDPLTGKLYTDTSKIVYGIGMAADNGGSIINDTTGVIRVYGEKSIGMYGKGVGTTVTNNGTIFLDGSRATATNKIQSMTGVYVDDGATFINNGLIRTADAYAGKNVSGKHVVNENVTGITGVAVMNGSTLVNNGKILIDANSSTGVVIRGKVDAHGNVVRYAVIKNYGEIKVRGKGTTGISYKDISAEDLQKLEALVNSKLTSDPQGQELSAAAGTNKGYEGVTITVKDGKPSFSRGGKPVSDKEVAKITEIIGKATSNVGISDVGFYVDTLGKTKPIDIDGTVAPINSQLIIGTEYSTLTNKKEWYVTDNAIKPFLQQIQGKNFKLTSLAGSLTWIATPVLDNHGQMKGVAMSKLPYTAFVKKSENSWNFADGLEQRYSMNALDSREKKLFNLLNTIGKNEQAILVQAYDEMMGHQYANVQQRVNATGVILDKEFKNLRAEENVSKSSNKVKTFGTKGDYKTDTAGVLDYKYNAYGVAYVHENEDIKLGRGTGWYTGVVQNTFKFKDIGNSKEEQLQTKVGLFKSVPFDDNNSLNWTVSGDIFAGYNKMHRKFLVVNEVFHAKARYNIYGIGVKNELNKEFRLNEDFSVRTYGALKLEYGRISKIREKTGEVRLEVKQNDYISVKPEVGTELAYKHYFGTKTLRTSVGMAYENELGKLANGKNKAKVVDTSADYFNVRGEKEDRRGNVKFDLNVGIDNQRVGVVGNVGYDTKGENVRGGLGLRVIF
ncbi:autotransporter-associated N-terminal domain-containing protein [Fusobacterium polymorphum]|uniref:autotransporter-associated N-terminal domain-containing protein n=1 Tax=Fusobacterium nucleatum subsp. polymorphum TaxID=76857 RepID=UPI00300A06B2